MLLLMVPFAHPNDVLGSGRNVADGTLFGLSAFLIVDGRLRPCLQMWLEIHWKGALHLPVGMPVKPCDQMLVVRLLCQSGCALLLGFKKKGSFYFPPGILEGGLILQEVVIGGSCPSVEGVHLPIPLHHIGDGCCRGSSDSVPWILFVLKLVVNGLPCLVEMGLPILWPCVKERAWP